MSHAALYLRAADLDHRVVEAAARDRSGEKLRLRDASPEGEPSVVFLAWDFPSPPPDFIHSLSQNLYVSERARAAWGLQTGAEVELVPLHLVGKHGRALRGAVNWWVKIRTRAAILDESRTEGSRMGPVWHEIRRYAVAWYRVPGVDVFLCDDTVSVVLSQRLVEIARLARLTGSIFRELDGGRWPPRSLGP
jgi:hypothetical protein